MGAESLKCAKVQNDHNPFARSNDEFVSEDRRRLTLNAKSGSNPMYLDSK